MQVKTVSVTYGRKLNLGDYNSAEIGVTLWAELDADDYTPADAIAVLFEEAKAAVKLQAIPLVKNDQRIAAEVTRKFSGQTIKED